jgi:exosortase family protein XrtF
MKSILKNNKPVLRFLAILIFSYTILYILYYYLVLNSKEIDYFTKIVSEQTVKVLNLIGYKTTAKTNKTNDFINLYVRTKNVAGITEGCNAISVIILFIAFVISFATDLKKTLLFTTIGVGIIHVMNIIRIVILTVCLYHFPKYSAPLHDYVFPAIIYGVVFILWMYWVNSFKKNK